MSQNEISFRNQLIQLQFSAPPTALADLQRAAATREDADLSFNSKASSEGKVVLLSKTGGTGVEIYSDRAILQTRYFAGFELLENFEARQKYTLEKLNSLLKLLEQHVSFEFIGISNIAKWSIGTDSTARDRTVEAISKSFNLQGVLSENIPVYDFSLRVSRVSEPYVYSNIHLSWYVERTITLSFEGPPPQQFTLKEWDMSSVIDEGLEFRYDRNNKYGLLNGKRDWTRSDFLEIAQSAMEDTPNALDHIQSYFRQTVGLGG